MSPKKIRHHFNLIYADTRSVSRKIECVVAAVKIMGCHHSSKVCNQEDEAKLQFQGGGPNNSLDALSMRRSDDVEEFFKKAYQYGNHMGALKEFMANNAAKLKLLEFLELEYYAKSPASFQV